MNIVLVVIDGLGVGPMPDSSVPSNTWADVVKHAQPTDFSFLKNISHKWTKLGLDYEGADSYLGHLTMSGIKTQQLSLQPLAAYMFKIKKLLKTKQWDFQINHGMLEVKNKFLIYDNFEAAPGLAINIAGLEEHFPFQEQIMISQQIRKIIKNPRLISFTAQKLQMHNYLSKSISQPPFFGILTPQTGVYNNTFKVVHLPFIQDFQDSFQHKFARNNWQVYLYGKFANIINIANHQNVTLNETIAPLAIFASLYSHLRHKTLHCINIQQADLAGHASDVKQYIRTLNAIDQHLSTLSTQADVMLIITSDHGNNPTLKGGRHSREYVPFWTSKGIPNLTLLSDVARYLNKFIDPPFNY